MFDYLKHTENALHDFACSIGEEKKPLADANAAIESNLICFAAELSIQEKRVVSIEEVSKEIAGRQFRS